MNRTSIRIAWRYLFSSRSHNAIHVVTGVSACGVMVVTAAIICVLSVLNGFSAIVQDMFSSFDTPLIILPAEGKTLRFDTPQMQAVRELEGVSYFSPTIEETALIAYSGKQVPARVKGVDDSFILISHIDSIITDGMYSLYDGAFERCVMGRGLAAEIGINPHFVGGLHIYSPKRNVPINLVRPEQSIHDEITFIAGTFATGQQEYDDYLMLVSYPLAASLFGMEEDEASAIHIGTDAPGKVKRQIRGLLGEEYRVLDRYEQQEDVFRMMKVEKMLTGLLLLFILLIAVFNIVGATTMLIIEKRSDMGILSALGATPAFVRSIFLYEGWMVSSIGAITGLLLGLAISLGQQHFGWLKLGNGTEYIISAYPVQVQAADVVLTLIAVLIIGWITSALATRSLKHS